MFDLTFYLVFKIKIYVEVSIFKFDHWFIYVYIKVDRL